MNPADAGKVIEKLVADARLYKTLGLHDEDVAALTLAIDAMKAKSDAETVLKVAEKHGWPINPPAPWLGVGYNEWQVQHVSAPTIHELAEKLRSRHE